MAPDAQDVISEQAIEDASKVTPNTLTGWSLLQREINVVLPLRLNQTMAQLREAMSAIGGRAL